MLHNPDVEMFSVQEWWWGIRDGYGGQMLSASLKHGGMLAVDGTANPVAASTAAAMPVTPIVPAVTVLPVAPVEDLYDPEGKFKLLSLPTIGVGAVIQFSDGVTIGCTCTL